MSSSPAGSPATIWLGLDVHKESVTIAVLRGDAPAPDRVDRLPNDLPKLKRYLERLAGQGPLRAVYEASGAGYVLHRAGELTVICIPTEAEERVRDLVRCRETFQREILKSRH